jgi:hypothetical protein
MVVIGSVELLVCKCVCGGTCVVSYKERLQRDTEDGLLRGVCGISGGGERAEGRRERWQKFSPVMSRSKRPLASRVRAASSIGLGGSA